MGLKEYFKSSKAEARKTPAQKETDKKIEKNVLDAAKEFARDRDNELKRSLRITRFALFFFVRFCGCNGGCPRSHGPAENNRTVSVTGR